MKISDIINNPHKLKELFEDALKKNDKENATLLINFIDDPYLVYRYASNIVNSKVSENLEKIIAKDPIITFYYIRDVLKTPFDKGEDAIAKNGMASYYYAKYILKKPFEKGENTIISGRFWLRDYLRFLESIGELEGFYQRHPNIKKEVENENQ